MKSSKQTTSKTKADKQIPADDKKVTLLKNHGLTIDGRACEFYEADTSFDAQEDAELIAALVQSGARLDY